MRDDNALTETLFRTLGYRPSDPVRGFADLAEAQEWVLGLVRWYNTEHRQSAPAFVTPGQRHTFYEPAKAERPER